MEERQVSTLQWIPRFYSTSCFPQLRLPQVEIEVPAYELPLPEGVGQEQGEGETLSMREIEETWKEKLIDSHTDSTSH